MRGTEQLDRDPPKAGLAWWGLTGRELFERNWFRVSLKRAWSNAAGAGSDVGVARTGAGERIGLMRPARVKSGVLHLRFSEGLSVTYAQLFVARWMRHMEAAGVELRNVLIQTDRGGEFSGGARKRHDLGFVRTVEHVLGSEHRYTPPRHPNANADLEASHRPIEREF